jgi:hypothetical protein
MPVGLLLLTLALGKLGYDWATRDFSLSANTLLLFLAAFQVMTTGLVADLVARGQRSPNLLPSGRVATENVPVTTDDPQPTRATQRPSEAARTSVAEGDIRQAPGP